jgi:tricarballylate dehydrogenase
MIARPIYDVLVAGGGNAGLCAALSARALGASVLIVEAAPRPFRGGNSRHTRNLRCAHDAPSGPLVDAYPESEYWDDLVDVTGGRTNETLARRLITGTADCRDWMSRHGARFQPSLAGTLQLSRTNAFFLGGGKALVNAYYESAARAGIEVAYDAEVSELEIEDGKFRSAIVRRHPPSPEGFGEAGGDGERIAARALVAASGGFQANLEWLESIWGDAARAFIIRGTPYDTGLVLRRLMDAGVRTVGDPSGCHAIAVDARAPRFDGGIATRVDSIPLGIVVNNKAERFYDEGQDFWPKRYAIWGRLIACEPDQIAYSIFDAQAIGGFIPPMHPPVEAASIGELAMALGLEPAKLERTVSAYNAAVRPGTFDPAIRDDCAAPAAAPPKSHWARRMERPPFFAYPLRPGITFTYLGVAVNERAQVVWGDGQPAANIFAAGEIMSGNVLGQGYLAGIGMAIGTVFGRIAGAEAARAVTR